MVTAVKRFEVWLVNLDPTQGGEINKPRPCVVISPDELNQFLRTVTIAALTSAQRAYPSRVDCQFQGKAGQVALDYVWSVDKSRLVRKLGTISAATAKEVFNRLSELFQY
jgi:mRNA interferase MazF